MFDNHRSRDTSPRMAADITELAAECGRLPSIAKNDLVPGDRVVVTTRNSTYVLDALGGHWFAASGGWFDRLGGQVVVRLNGCTFGGHAIHDGLVAAPGLFLEFGNGVKSSEIRQAQLHPSGAATLLN